MSFRPRLTASRIEADGQPPQLGQQCRGIGAAPGFADGLAADVHEAMEVKQPHAARMRHPTGKIPSFTSLENIKRTSCEASVIDILYRNLNGQSIMSG